jgi:outer membrane lipoprotein SlyB
VFYISSFRQNTYFLQVRNFFPLPYLLPAPCKGPCCNLLRSRAFFTRHDHCLYSNSWQQEKDLFVSRNARKEAIEMNATRKFANTAPILLLAGTLTAVGCAGGPLTTREKGAGIGALGGAAAGGLIGSAVGHPAAGAAIGGGLGLGTGALLGDQLQGQENQNTRQDEQIRRNNTELERQRQELERVRRQQEEY